MFKNYVEKLINSAKAAGLPYKSEANINAADVDAYVRQQINAKAVQAKIARSQTAASALKEPKFFWPVAAARITSRFGWRKLKFEGKMNASYHRGIDLACDGPKDILAPEDGIVKKVVPLDAANPCLFYWDNEKGWMKKKPPKGKTWNDGTYGWTPYFVIVGKHSKRMYTFRHAVTTITPGTIVTAGAVVGEYGNYGYSMGAHLHFEVRPYSEVVVKGTNWPEVVDPIPALESEGALK